MGRRSLARERRAQILDAFEHCVLEHGLERASIAAIAEVAGVDRTLVHHYFGTRQTLEEALVERLVAGYRSRREEAVAAFPPEDRLSSLLDYLFSPDFGHPRLDALFEELVSAAHRNASVRSLLLRAYSEFERIVAAELEKAHPEAPGFLRQQVAYSIMCLAECTSGFTELGFPETRRDAARASAEALLRTLDDSPGA